MSILFDGTDVKMMESVGQRTYQNATPSFFNRYYLSILSVLEVAADLLVMLSATLLGYGLFIDRHGVESDWSHYTVVAVCITLLGFFLFERFGLYQKQVSLMNLIEIRKNIRAVSVLFVVLALSSFFLPTTLPLLFAVYASAFILVFTLVERLLFFKFQQALHMRGVGVRRVLLLGAGREARQLYQNIHRAPKLGYLVVGFWDDDKAQIEIARDWFGGTKSNLVFSTDFEEVEGIISRERVDEVFMCHASLDSETSSLRAFHHFCLQNDIKFSFAPFVNGYYPSQIKVTDIGGIPMISFGAISVSLAEQVSKRIFDLVLGTIFIICASPFFVLISILIHRSDSSGKVLFKQQRVGKDGVEFSMYKFRTMYGDTPEYGHSPRSSNDPRITNIGRFLRRTSLDELPQLINVLRGEMSLVGPRPEMPFIVAEYDDLCRERLCVKPGITGVWQISADRTREIHENISYDIFYIENRSLLLDSIILVRTMIFAILAMKTH